MTVDEEELFCSNCGEPLYFDQDLCDECDEEEYLFEQRQLGLDGDDELD